MRVIGPQYKAVGGEIFPDPLLAVRGPPEVDLDGLACLFASPSLFGEVTPGSFWRGVSLHWPPPEAACLPTEPLIDAFRKAVKDCCQDAQTIAIQTSGGLDSLAVLRTCCELFPDRQIIALCGNIVDDDGVSTVDVVRSLIAKLRLRCKLVVVGRNEWREWPQWSPHGPFRTAVPSAHAAMARIARQEGADVLLSGDGADELVAIHRFAAKAIARGKGLREAGSYLRDAMMTGPGLTGELLAVVADLLPARLRLQMYWAINWPEWCVPSASKILREPYYSTALRWAEAWLRSSLEDHIKHKRSWCEAEALDAWWPQPFLAWAGELPEGSPFLHEHFVSVALAHPASSRYSRSEYTTYHKIKSGVVALFPPEDRALLPPRKQYFTKFAADMNSKPAESPLGIELGLFNRQALRDEQDTMTRKLIVAVEHWLQGALQIGANLKPVAPSHRSEVGQLP